MGGILIFILIGAIAGWLAGNIMKGGGFGLIGNVVVGIAGAMVGGLLFGMLGLHAGGLLGRTIMATVGAILLLYLARLLRN